MYARRRGVGDAPVVGPCTSMPLLAILAPSCWSRAWSNLTASDPVIAAPQAPPQSVWSTPPASGVDAQATVDSLLNQQLRDQQALNAGTVESTWEDEVGGSLYQVGDAVGKAATVAFNWLPWALGAAGVFALVTLTAGSPRRYGR